MLKTAILGSTGSVGTQALDVARHNLNIKITAVTANRSVSAVEAQIREFRPSYAALEDEAAARDLKTRVADCNTKVLCGREGVSELIATTDADAFVNSVIGFDGLFSTLEVIKTGKRLALSNKESIVAAGEAVMALAKKSGTEILPVDSEHCAIHQCLRSGTHGEISKLIITASGGPFYGKTPAELDCVTLADALAHPTWSMGKKITVDSATLMNKGFEVIEAARLFDVPADKIEVVVHPESIIHSMVEYIDSAVIAQMSVPDMRLCVAYALNYPERIHGATPPLDLFKTAKLTFKAPDLETFPLLSLAFKALSNGKTRPAVLNAANEIAVHAFLREEISFKHIPEVVFDTYEKTPEHSELTVESIYAADGEARRIATEVTQAIINKRKR